jgi:hypothetical protein
MMRRDARARPNPKFYPFHSTNHDPGPSPPPIHSTRATRSTIAVAIHRPRVVVVVVTVVVDARDVTLKPNRARHQSIGNIPHLTPIPVESNPRSRTRHPRAHAMRAIRVGSPRARSRTSVPRAARARSRTSPARARSIANNARIPSRASRPVPSHPIASRVTSHHARTMVGSRGAQSDAPRRATGGRRRPGPFDDRRRRSRVVY